MHEFFGLDNSEGLVEVLQGKRHLRECWHEYLPALKVLTAGAAPTRPADLLESEHFARFLEQTRQDFDYVLIDTPPLEAVPDADILTARADGVLLVINAENIHKAAVLEAAQKLRVVGANVLGTVFNHANTLE